MWVTPKSKRYTFELRCWEQIKIRVDVEKCVFGSWGNIGETEGDERKRKEKIKDRTQ